LSIVTPSIIDSIHTIMGFMELDFGHLHVTLCVESSLMRFG